MAMRRRKDNKIGRKIVKTVTWRAPVQEDGLSDEKRATEPATDQNSDIRKNHNSISLYISTLINKLTRRIKR
jgi:hypothetical protein